MSPSKDAAYVTVSVEDMGERQTGLWCPHCALPSAMSAVMMLMLNGKPDHTFRMTWCVDCGRWETK